MRRLWVLACMDERLPVDEALGIRADSPVGGGDAHLFRNAGGIVTDDAIRSAMLTINFFGTREIIVLQHTGCGMLSANGDDLEKALRGKAVDVELDPHRSVASRADAEEGRLRQVDRHDGRCRRNLHQDGRLFAPSSADPEGHHDLRLDLGNRVPPPARAHLRWQGQGRTQFSAATMGVKGAQPPRWK